MTEATIFDAPPTPPSDQGAPPPPAIVLPDSVKELVGEGKKYATVEKALEALAHAQTHIATIEQDNRTLREKVEGAMSVEKVYETVQELLSKERPTGAAPLDEASIASVLDRKLTEREQNARRAANVESVKQALAGKFGDKASEQFRAKAEELGLSVQTLNELAATSPKAALEYFGVKPNSVPGRPSSTVNSEALQTRPPEQRPAKTVMGGATSKEVTAAWQTIKERYTKGN